MSDDLDRVMARIRKMLALTNDAAATEGERDTAMRMVQATLAKHNLDLANVEASGGAAGEARHEDKLEVRGSPWVRRVAHGVGKLFFCKYYYQKGRGKSDTHCFVGRLSNTQTAKEMLPWLVKALRAEAYRLAPKDGAFRTTFLKAAAQRIFDRCEALIKEPVAEAVPGTAVVLASYYRTEMDANLAFLKDQGTKLSTKISRERHVGLAGYAEGTAFGSSINLSRQLSGGSKPRRLT